MLACPSNLITKYTWQPTQRGAGSRRRCRSSSSAATPPPAWCVRACLPCLMPCVVRLLSCMVRARSALSYAVVPRPRCFAAFAVTARFTLTTPTGHHDADAQSCDQSGQGGGAPVRGTLPSVMCHGHVCMLHRTHSSVAGMAGGGRGDGGLPHRERTQPGREQRQQALPDPLRHG